MCSPPLPRCGCRGHHCGWGALAAWSRQWGVCSDVAGGFTEPWGPPCRATLLWVVGVLSAVVGFVVGCGWWLRWWAPREGRVRLRQVAAAVGCGWWLRAGGDRSGGGCGEAAPYPRPGSGGPRPGGPAAAGCGQRSWLPQCTPGAVPATGPPAPAGQQPEPPNRRRRHPHHPGHRPKGGAAATPYGVRRSRDPSTPHTARRPAAPDDHPWARRGRGQPAVHSRGSAQPARPAARYAGRPGRGPAGAPAPGSRQRDELQEIAPTPEARKGTYGRGRAQPRAVSLWRAGGGSPSLR